VVKAKARVVDNLRYKCPTLESSNYMSLYRFQDTLNKQLKHDFDLNEYKWVSFFDEVLEMAIDISKSVEDFIFNELQLEFEQITASRHL
jgi:hypothetical protein